MLEAVWQDEDGPVADAVYSREMLLGSIDLDWDDVQWAANIVRSRCTRLILSNVGRASALKGVNSWIRHSKPWSEPSLGLHTSKLVLHEAK